MSPIKGQRRRVAGIAHASAVFASILLIGGCAATPFDALTSDPLAQYDGTGRTAKTAMSEYTETLDHVMTLVEPTEMIAPLPRWSRSSRQLACLNDHSRTMVLNAHGGVLAPSANPEAILERIADDYEERTQWVVTRSTEATPGRLEFIKLENDSGMRAYVSVRVDTAQAQLETLGHTACFSQPRVTIDQSR